MTNNTEQRRALDSMSVVDSIAETLKKGGSKLSEAQLMLMHGAMAVWFGEIQKAALAQRENTANTLCTAEEAAELANKATSRDVFPFAFYKGQLNKEELAAIINAARAKR